MNNLFCFHNNEFDEMRCKLDSTEYARSFRKYPTLLRGEMGTERGGNQWGLWTELWEREGNRESSCEKNLPASAGRFFLSIASESEKMFARILDESLSCLDLPKNKWF